MRFLSVAMFSKLHSSKFLRYFLALSLAYFVSFFISLLLGLHIFTNNPTAFLLLTSFKQSGLVCLSIHIHTQIHRHTWRALELRMI